MIVKLKFKIMEVYIPEGETYIKFDVSNIKNASINGITEYLGYDHCQVYSPISSSLYNIPVIVFEVFSKKVLFAFMDAHYSNQDVTQIINKYIKSVSLLDIYEDYFMFEDDLIEGINRGVFSVDFMSSVLGIIIDPNGSIICEDLRCEFTFKDGLLKRYAKREN